MSASSCPPKISDGQKNPYSFEFLTIADDAAEQELERGLVAHIRQFLIELGAGFAFLGQQCQLNVGGEDFYIDLLFSTIRHTAKNSGLLPRNLRVSSRISGRCLFYHVKLRCYVIIDLKTTPFKPEYAGKMNFYLSAADDLLRHPDDKPSIGIILCKSKNKVVAEYALRDLAKPVSVSSYVPQLVESLPPALRGSLPSPKELEAELNKDDTGGR